jgi:hypothetical protein
MIGKLLLWMVSPAGVRFARGDLAQSRALCIVDVVRLDGEQLAKKVESFKF